MARRLMRSKHEVAVYDLKQESVATLAKEGAIGATDFADLAKKLTKPRAVWLMVPAGTSTEETIEHLRPFLESGDTIIDGGNSFYKDDVRRSFLPSIIEKRFGHDLISARKLNSQLTSVLQRSRLKTREAV